MLTAQLVRPKSLLRMELKYVDHADLGVPHVLLKDVPRAELDILQLPILMDSVLLLALKTISSMPLILSVLRVTPDAKEDVSIQLLTVNNVDPNSKETPKTSVSKSKKPKSDAEKELIFPKMDYHANVSLMQIFIKTELVFQSKTLLLNAVPDITVLTATKNVEQSNLTLFAKYVPVMP